jgi:hypothetical protein
VCYVIILKWPPGELDAAKEYIVFLEEQMSAQLAESKAAEAAAQSEVRRLNDALAFCANCSNSLVQSVPNNSNKRETSDSSEIQHLMQQLADAQQQVFLFGR